MEKLAAAVKSNVSTNTKEVPKAAWSARKDCLWLKRQRSEATKNRDRVNMAKLLSLLIFAWLFSTTPNDELTRLEQAW